MSCPVDTFSTCWALWLASYRLVENRALWNDLLDVESPNAGFTHARLSAYLLNTFLIVSEDSPIKVSKLLSGVR